jgi:hypothetical protein
MIDSPPLVDQQTAHQYADWKANTPTQHSIEEYVKSVNGWAIFGYHPELHINGNKYDALNAFYSSGPNKNMYENGTVTDVSSQRDIKAIRRIVQNISSHWQFGIEGFKNPSTSMIVSISSTDEATKKTVPNHKIIHVGCFTDNSGPRARGGADKSFSLIGLMVPSSMADAFEKDIQTAPDFANELLVRALDGIDDLADRPGLKRYRADSLIYIPGSKLNSIGGDGGVDPTNAKQLSAFLSECPKIPFKGGPYGVKDYAKK